MGGSGVLYEYKARLGLHWAVQSVISRSREVVHWLHLAGPPQHKFLHVHSAHLLCASSEENINSILKFLVEITISNLQHSKCPEDEFRFTGTALGSVILEYLVTRI